MAGVGNEIGSPVRPDGLVTSEKLGHLLALQTEYPDLDYKRTLDLRARRDEVELAKDVGAMQVGGGYIVIGVDDRGTPTGELDPQHLPLFDEARLTPKLLKYLPEPLQLRTRTFDIDGKAVALVYVGSHPDGCSIFRSDGTYGLPGDRGEAVVFRAGDIFWRDGTRSVRLTQEGFREIIRRRVARDRHRWIAEQQEIRRQERAAVEAAHESARLAVAPLGSLSLDLDGETLATAALELVRRDDPIPLRRLLRDGFRHARVVYDQEPEFESELGDVLDKLACIAAAFLDYELDVAAREVVGAAAGIYNLGLDEFGRRLDYATAISPEDKRPRLWLLVAERIYALGGAAVRLRRWNAVRQLALARPEDLDEYYSSWLRHALTMAARAQRLETQQSGQRVQLSLLNLAREHVVRLACLRVDASAPDDDMILTSLAQFDLLQALAAVAESRSLESGVFYPNFARFRSDRVEPAVVRLITERDMREEIFPLTDTDLAFALATVANLAEREGGRFVSGFSGFRDDRITRFIETHAPATLAATALTPRRQ